MSLYQTEDPSNSFYEEVQVGRIGHDNHDVTIYYTVYNRGRGGKWNMFRSSFLRHLDIAILWSKYIQHSFALNLSLEFSITDGGNIIKDKQDGPNRKLRVETRRGVRFSITRLRGKGGLCLSLPVPFFTVGDKYDQTCIAKIIHFLSRRIPFKHLWILEKWIGTYILLTQR